MFFDTNIQTLVYGKNQNLHTMVNVRERGVNNEIMVEYCKEYFFNMQKNKR